MKSGVLNNGGAARRLHRPIVACHSPLPFCKNQARLSRLSSAYFKTISLQDVVLEENVLPLPTPPFDSFPFPSLPLS